ncbi:MAG TPA: hypothetical protein DHV55_02250 [Clostridiaceae bacterium]|nr:hypothetical protein [Clostridiaceae bacterium]
MKCLISLANSATGGDVLNISESYQEACRLLKQNRKEASKKIFESILAEKPGHFESINKLGTIYAIQGELDDAKNMYLKALEINPDYVPALCNLANIYNQNGDFENALKYYSISIEKDSKYPMTYYNLSVLYKSHKDYDNYLKCINQYKKSLKNQIDQEDKPKILKGRSRTLIIAALIFIVMFIFSIIRGRYI